MAEELQTEFDIAEYDIRQRWRTRPPKTFPATWACEWGFDEYGLWQTFEVKGISHKMRYIPPGSFLMGATDGEDGDDDEMPQHKVTLTQGFWMGETTVTQTLWQAVMENNPSHFKAKADEQLPVEQVSWDDCQPFCNKLNELTQASFTLPTEAQWEYACRAGSTTPFNTGEQLGFEQGNYNVNHPNHGKQPLQLQPGQEYRDKTVDVHQFPANAWGLKQMHGNVLEWCQDDWKEELGAQHLTDPLQSGNQAARAVLRGGCWCLSGRSCRSAYRSRNRRDVRSNLIGLRVTQVE